MGRRLDLHQILKAALGSDQVYFQPPPSVQMAYPAIVYNRDGASTHHADGKPYNVRWRYSITVIDQDPDSEIPTRVIELPMCEFDRFYTADNLNHNTFRMFF